MEKKKLKLKKDIKIMLIYLALFPLVTILLNFKTLEHFIIYVVLYAMNMGYIIALVIDKKNNKKNNK